MKKFLLAAAVMAAAATATFAQNAPPTVMSDFSAFQNSAVAGVNWGLLGAGGVAVGYLVIRFIKRLA